MTGEAKKLQLPLSAQSELQAYIAGRSTMNYVSIGKENMADFLWQGPEQFRALLSYGKVL